MGGAGDKEIGTDQKDIHIHLDDEHFLIAPWISLEQKMKKSVGAMYSQPLHG